MLRIVFKNLKPSSLIQENVKKRIKNIVEKFPVLKEHRMTLTLEMENSPKQAGPDLFNATTMINGKLFKNIKIKRSAYNLYVALAELVDRLNGILSQENERLQKNYKKHQNYLNQRSNVAS